jgi:chemotaxis protein methyltransferase CheR
MGRRQKETPQRRDESSMTTLAAAAEVGLPAISREEFALFQALIRKEAGIHLSEAKKALLVGRLTRRLRELGLPSFSAYYRRVKVDAAERVHMVDRVSTNETHFFREPRQFEFLESCIVPEWLAAGPRLVRVWSAGSSTGEEAYSVACVLQAELPAERGWRLEILGTDISTRVLEQARAALWPIAKASEIPARYLRPFFLRGYGSQEGRMKAGPDIRAVVDFQHESLIDAQAAPRAPFDAIFCRNVLIYFDAATKRRVIERLVSHLAPGGYLFLGHAESLQPLAHGMKAVGPTVYRRIPGPVRAR